MASVYTVHEFDTDSEKTKFIVGAYTLPELEYLIKEKKEEEQKQMDKVLSVEELLKKYRKPS